MMVEFPIRYREEPEDDQTVPSFQLERVAEALADLRHDVLALHERIGFSGIQRGKVGLSTLDAILFDVERTVGMALTDTQDEYKAFLRAAGRTSTASPRRPEIEKGEEQNERST